IAAGDYCTLEIGIAFDIHVVTTVTSKNASLFSDTGVVGIDTAVAVVSATCKAVANRNTATDVLLFAAVGAGVLQAFDIEIALYIGNDAPAFGDGANQVGVALGVEREG